VCKCAKRIKCFTEGEVSVIKEETLDYTSFFEKDRVEIPMKQQFDPPANFMEAQIMLTSFVPDVNIEFS